MGLEFERFESGGGLFAGDQHVRCTNVMHEIAERLTRKSCSAYSNTMYIDLSSSITSLKATRFR